jgi:hypothetical protein
MQLTEQHVIDRSDPRFAVIDAAVSTFNEREERSTERRAREQCYCVRRSRST